LHSSLEVDYSEERSNDVSATMRLTFMRPLGLGGAGCVRMAAVEEDPGVLPISQAATTSALPQLPGGPQWITVRSSRERLGWRSPGEAYAETVAMTD